MTEETKTFSGFQEIRIKQKDYNGYFFFIVILGIFSAAVLIFFLNIVVAGIMFLFDLIVTRLNYFIIGIVGLVIIIFIIKKVSKKKNEYSNR